jgi:glucans biosynthesis protein
LPRAEVTASAGKIQNVVVQPNAILQGWRVSFELTPDGDKLSELAMQLVGLTSPPQTRS